jgi:poly[(R)-3-hydroxyalkanoate] polymerase subunit PhaE
VAPATALRDKAKAMGEQTESMGNWMHAWADVQRRSWDAWSSVARTALTAAPASGAGESKVDPWRLWRESLSQWQAAFGPQSARSVQELYGRLMEQGFSYLRVSEELFKAFQNVEAAYKAGADWMTAVNRSFEQAKDAFSKACADSTGAAQGCMALLGLPMDTWRRVVSSLSLFPGDFLQLLKQEDVRHVADALRLRFEQFLSIPALGYTRESQEQVQEGMRYWVEYEEALRKYTTVFAKVGVRALDLFQRKFLEAASSEQRPDTVRALYDQWVDCAEKAYAEVVSTGEYEELSAAVINSSMALKRHGQLMVDEMLSAMNMPSRRELNTAHERIHRLNREVMALQEQARKTGAADLSKAVEKIEQTVESLDVAGLQSQLAELRAELASLKRSHAEGGGSRTKPASRADGGAPRKSRAPAKQGGK